MSSLTNREEPAWLRQALDIVERGLVVALPFEYLFGLAANALDARAVDRVAAIKDRHPGNAGNKPISVILPNWGSLGLVTHNLPPLARRLAKSFWPGPLTLVVPAAQGLPRQLVSESGLIGVRLPGPCAAKILAEQSGQILTATSANRSDEPNVCCHKDLAGLKGIELIVEGRVQGGVGSTVVDASGKRPIVLRQGSVDIGQG